MFWDGTNGNDDDCDNDVMANIFPWKFAIRNTYFSLHLTLCVDTESVVCFYETYRPLHSLSLCHTLLHTLFYNEKTRENWNQTIAESRYLLAIHVGLSFVRSFVFGFVNKLRAGRMNAITNKSWILCVVFSCCMFLFIAFCLYISLHNSTLIYMISNGCSIEQCLLSLYTSPCCSLYLFLRNRP